MTFIRTKILAACLALVAAAPAISQDAAIDSFDPPQKNRWEFFADGVMGGVSEGSLSFLTEGGVTFARLEGIVSTRNNGGFIQIRMALKEPAPTDAKGVRIVVRGNGAPYFVHLRTRGTLMPWQYYQAGFNASSGWQEIHIPFSAFKPSGSLLRKTPRSRDITSAAIVAFGRDYAAKVDLRYIGFYK